jgi:hypothetical protein
MAKQVINVGAAANDGTGDPARTAFTKTNSNFTELYGTLSGGTAPANVSIGAPATGVALTVSGNSTVPTLSLAGAIGSGSTTSDFLITRTSSANTIQNGPCITLADGTTNNNVTLQAGAGTFGVWNYGAGAWNERFLISPNGNATINAPSSGQALTMTGIAAGTAALTINTAATTGAQTATFTATNKPGTGTTAPSKWLPIILDGTTYYIPAWT